MAADDGRHRAAERVRNDAGEGRDDLSVVREALDAWMSKQRSGPKASGDMADIIDLMLATGARIGEALAVRWTAVQLDAIRTSLNINAMIKTEPGEGTYRKPTPKSDASVRTVILPDFAVAVLRRRLNVTGEDRQESVLPTRNCTWQQVNNVGRRWRQIRQDTGLHWVTPPMFRKTLATLISERDDTRTVSQYNPRTVE